MGQRGPASQPAEVHALFGDPSKLGASKLQPQLRPDVKAPARPRFLGKLALKEWNRITSELLKIRMLTPLDRAALADYCQAYGEFEECESAIQALMVPKRRDGETDEQFAKRSEKSGVEALVDVAQSGYRQIGVLVQLRDRAADRMLKTAREFGLTPAARLRVLAIQQLPLFPGEDDDPMNAYLKAGSSVGRVAA